MTPAKKVILAAAPCLFAAWIYSRIGQWTGDSDAFIRVVLSVVYALLIMFRWKMADEGREPKQAVILISAVAGSLAAVTGIVFGIGQFEWLGLILLLTAALRWALPARFSTDILLAMLLLYWMHPLPSRLLDLFQLKMQTLSITGSEWLLQCFNISIWADMNDFILRTGLTNFGIEQACSGMKTAVTVFLCALGTSILLRYRWYETAVLIAAGVAQVVAINILRISFTVFWAPRMPAEWATGFLHDTLGVLLLVGIVLVQAEAAWWKIRTNRRIRREQAIADGTEEPPDGATILPQFWRIVNKYKWAGLFAILLAAGTGAAIMKRQPAHRAAMISGVIDGLLESDHKSAERAVGEALRLAPYNRDLVTKKIQALVMQGKHKEALDEIGRLEGAPNLTEVVMKSWALMALGRAQEASAALDALSPGQRSTPGVAIVLAQYAAIQNKPETVASNVLLAARSRVTAGRVRDLFPYLASHEQWGTIVNADNPIWPYQEFSHCLIAVRANIEAGRLNVASQILKIAMKSWPGDVRLISSLYALAESRPGGEWEEMFSQRLLESINTLDADRASTFMNYAFQLNRPELGWLAYAKLAKLDPDDPALLLAASRFGETWFVFRKHRIGMVAADGNELVDLRPFLRHAGGLQPFNLLCSRIPLAAELLEQTDGEYYAGRCLEELVRREKAGKLTLRLELLYPTVLSILGRFAEAHVRLDGIEKKYPQKQQEVMLQRIRIYVQQREWHHAYEAILKCRGNDGMPDLSRDKLFVSTLMNMDLGVCALDVAESLKRTYPEYRQFDGMLAALWAAFGYKDQALFTLRDSAGSIEPPLYAQLLYDTGRIRESELFCLKSGAKITRAKVGTTQAALLTPAEFTVSPERWPAAMTAEQMSVESGLAAKRAAQAKSPFVADLEKLTAKWYGAGGRGEAAELERWEKAGRNKLEKGAALHRLAILHARQRDFVPAAAAAGRAVEFIPQSGILWRVLAAVTGGRPDVVAAALVKCPDDPELRLASLVVKQRDLKGEPDRAELELLTGEGKFPVETAVRAGDFLLRKGSRVGALFCARAVQAREPGFLPANVLGLRCALATNDLAGAMDCCLKASENGLDPIPFYKAIAVIGEARKSTEMSVVAALEFLHDRYPHDSEWTRRLAYLYFNKGDTKRTRVLLQPLVEQGVGGLDVQTILLAAEVTRVEGDLASSVAILEEGCRLHPESLSMTNNLVYCLAHGRETAPKALVMMEDLLKKAGDRRSVQQTAAFVYMRNGQLDKAESFFTKAGGNTETNGYAYLETELNSAEFHFRKGDFKAAKPKLEAIRRDANCPPDIDVEARRMLERIELRSNGSSN